MDAILNQPPPAPARFNYALTADVEAVLRKALEKTPEIRYQGPRPLHRFLTRRIALDGRRGPASGFRAAAAAGVVAPPENSIAVITFTNITREPSTSGSARASPRRSPPISRTSPA